jgi:hypothetical protein
MRARVGRGVRVAIAVVFASALASSAQAGLILAPGATWNYTFTNPGSGLGWTTGAGTFPSNGAAPFGNQSGGDFGFHTFWPADGSDGDDLWVRRTFDTTGFILPSITWNLGVDNGFKLYVNGVLVQAANAEGFTFRWEYGGSLAPYVTPGTNWVAVALEDHGGATAFDMQIEGSTVPEPGTLLLLGSGLVGLVSRRRRGR